MEVALDQVPTAKCQTQSSCSASAILPSMRIAYFECTRCGEHLSADQPQNTCPKDGGVLYVRYDLAGLRGKLKAADLKGRVATMWRYADLLPDAKPVTLGEGFTPMLPSREFPNVFIKDEGLNPTGSFKARGMSAALTMARHYGLKKLAAPSAGNAGGALAAFAAAAAIEAHIFMPKDVPIANRMECDYYGAHVTLVDGLISDCGRIVGEKCKTEGWFDISTLKEPYRIEGKKTMGYEVAEQFRWTLPDAIFYPAGGGVGLIGMWKAFEEMEELGWVPKGGRPKMIAVQSSGCAPVARAYETGATVSTMWQNAATFAAGLRVPKPYGDAIILDIVRASEGVAMAVSDEEILASILDWARNEGIFLSPEGASVTAAYDKLLANGYLKPSDRVVLFNTGAGLKYTDMTAEAMKLKRPSAQ